MLDHLVLLDAAIRHAKKTVPRLSDRRAAALSFVQKEHDEFKRLRRWQDAVQCQLLLYKMRGAETLSSLMETLRAANEAEAPVVPPACNTGVRSCNEELAGGPQIVPQGARVYEAPSVASVAPTTNEGELHAILSLFVAGR